MPSKAERNAARISRSVCYPRIWRREMNLSVAKPKGEVDLSMSCIDSHNTDITKMQ